MSNHLLQNEATPSGRLLPSRGGDNARERKIERASAAPTSQARRKELAFLAASELRSVEPEGLARHIAARDRQERLLVEILRTGTAHGAFHAPDPRQVARSLTTMCTGISQWFDAAGPLSPSEIAADYVRYAQRIVRQ